MNNLIKEIEKEITKNIDTCNQNGVSVDYQRGLLKALEIIAIQKDFFAMPSDLIDHPNHYNKYSVEVIEMMTRIFGAERTAIFCELNAFKYRMRMGLKSGNDLNQDFEKEQWYLRAQTELLAKK